MSRRQPLALVREQTFTFALVLVIGLLIANVVALPSFASWHNVPQDLAIFAPLALVAIANTPSILSGGGGLDLSVAPLMNLVNIIFVIHLLPHGLGAPEISVPLLVVLGASVGAANGTLVTVFRYQPVIATLCAYFVILGINSTLAKEPATAAANWTSDFAHDVGPVPGALLLLLVPAAVWLFLRRTPFLTALYLVGGNDAASYASGIDVTAVRIGAYALGGAFAAIAGLCLTALLQSADTAFATQYTLAGLAAVAIGGTPIGGGRGGLLGSLLGAAVIYLLQNLLGSLHVAVSWLQVVYGVLLIVGMVLAVQLTGVRGEAR